MYFWNPKVRITDDVVAATSNLMLNNGLTLCIYLNYISFITLIGIENELKPVGRLNLKTNSPKTDGQKLSSIPELMCLNMIVISDFITSKFHWN